MDKKREERLYSQEEYDAAVQDLLTFIRKHHPTGEHASLLYAKQTGACDVARAILSMAIIMTEMPHLSLESFTDKASISESQIDAWRLVLDQPRWVFAGQKVGVEGLENLTDWAVNNLWGCAVSILNMGHEAGKEDDDNV